MEQKNEGSSSAGLVITIVGVVLIGALVAWAGSVDGRTVWGGVPLFALAVAGAFLIQWLVYIPSILARTEKYFDLTGSLTFIAISIALLIATPNKDLRSWILALAVILWAVRLGSFLFARVARSGSDSRFDTIKNQPLPFLRVWTMQGLWVSVTAAAAWIAIASGSRQPVDIFAIIGIILWFAGMAIETTADWQKQQFRANPSNKGKFIDIGLWSRSRHPNYFGEITLWVGVFLIAAPTLQGWQWVAILSPIFVILLLTKVSGIPPQEKQAEKRWGDTPEYQAYKSRTNKLIPRIRPASTRKIE
ncbi:DUF1295 domain-containing protein [Haematomicrobium sanguinis]|uniref:DUF1295 domain-containing protein n=1 Tax=Haematomicrobium sanguinis TaxID=479106 RepID=UPI000690573F|nr:DUF1295 domain-containing protein [Haematomicrobium sanguinis]